MFGQPGRLDFKAIPCQNISTFYLFADACPPKGDGKASRQPKENVQQNRKPGETQGPCLDLSGFCIKAIAVAGFFKSKHIHLVIFRR
jgi:hypothetical protein